MAKAASARQLLAWVAFAGVFAWAPTASAQDDAPAGGPPPASPASETTGMHGAGFERGDVLAAAGDWEAAKNAYQQVAEASHDSVPAWYRLGVARAIAGDPAGAAEAFRRVRQLAPTLPEIDQIIAAADERAAFDAAQALDPAATFSDLDARTEARQESLAARLWLHGVRYELVGQPGESAAADAMTAALEGDALAAAEAASQAAAQDHQEPAGYLIAAQRWLLAGDLERARYFLTLYETFQGDPADAAPLFEELRAPL